MSKRGQTWPNVAKRGQTWPNVAKRGPLYQPKKLREASTHGANSGQDCVQARNKKQ